MTKALWESRFSQLMAENLIIVPNNYYEDKLPFNDAEALNQIFTELEEKNLTYIHTLQEKQQILEGMKETEKTLHEQLNKKRNVYVGQKMELEMKIAEIESQLSTIGKRKKDVNADGPGKNTTISHDQMLAKLAKKIRKVYKNSGFNNDVANKQPLEILNVSELNSFDMFLGIGTRMQHVGLGEERTLCEG